MKIPNYIGPAAFGIKMGVILPGCELENLIMEEIRKVHRDGLLSDCDTICITESIIARAQNNYISTEDIAREIQDKLSLKKDSRIGVLFPILSRNRFSLILSGIAQAVPEGEVIVQLSYPDDEVGNQAIPPEVAEELETKRNGVILPEDLGAGYKHPLTGVNYIELYKDIIEEAGAKASLFLCNQPTAILDYDLDAVISADIHTRKKNKDKLASKIENCITLQDIFNDPSEREQWSEFGLLGSNMSSSNRLKLAPYNSEEFACDIQERIQKETGKTVEILIYGDGAYKDPSSGIYELADPRPVFGATPAVCSVMREGVKYKYLIDLYHEDGKKEEEIMEIIEQEAAKDREINSIISEGTTPRQMEDVLASLADLVSGSADQGTPIVLIKGIYNR